MGTIKFYLQSFQYFYIIVKYTCSFYFYKNIRCHSFVIYIIYFSYCTIALLKQMKLYFCVHSTLLFVILPICFVCKCMSRMILKRCICKYCDVMALVMSCVQRWYIYFWNFITIYCVMSTVHLYCSLFD